MKKNQNRLFEIIIDKITNSIQNSVTGEELKTEVLPFMFNDLKKLKKTEWVFDWETELNDSSKEVYKLIAAEHPDRIHGLISIEDKGDHIFMHLIESSKSNRGSKKTFFGVPGNLVAWACKISFEKKYEGFVSFESKTKLIAHYKKSLGAYTIFRKMMAISTNAARHLVESYFPENP